MTTSNNELQRGFDFPGTFELIAIGAAGSDLDQLLIGALASTGVLPDPASVRRRASSQGHYASIAISFYAVSRDQYDAAHEAVRALPEVKWTI